MEPAPVGEGLVGCEIVNISVAFCECQVNRVDKVRGVRLIDEGLVPVILVIDEIA